MKILKLEHKLYATQDSTQLVHTKKIFKQIVYSLYWETGKNKVKGIHQPTHDKKPLPLQQWSLL